MNWDVVAIVMGPIIGIALQAIIRVAVRVMFPSPSALPRDSFSLRPSRRDVVAIAFMAIGILSLAFSYFGILWVQAPRQGWWEAFHLELGAGLILVGAIDTIIMDRLPKEVPSTG